MFEDRFRILRSRLATRKVWLNPKTTMTQIEAIEARIGFTLPDEYREFLLQIGDGGVGPPYYGIFALHDENRPKDEELEFPQFSVRPPQTEEDWNSDTAFDWDELSFHQRVESECFLWLGTDGCAMYYLLGVTGPERGFIWFFEDGVGQPLVNPEGSERISFLNWYEDWLNNASSSSN